MALNNIDNIIARYSMLYSLSTSDLEDSLDRNVHHTQAMQAHIAQEMSRLDEEPASQAEPNNQAAQLQEQERQEQQRDNGRRNCTSRASVSVILNTPPAGGGS